MPAESHATAQTVPVASRSKPLRVLVLGGTGLVGTAVTDAAIAAGHHVTIVHRGRSAGADARVGVHPGASEIILDRVTDGHAGLADLDVDAVIDVSGYLPAIVREACQQIGNAQTHWCYVSSASVFADTAIAGNDESSPVLEIGSPSLLDEVLGSRDFDWRGNQLYGECKVLCERAVEAHTGGAASILRPCVIAGRGDATWRFSYWVERGMRGSELLTPSPAEQPVGVVDVRDLAEFAVRACEQRLRGPFVIAPDPAETTFQRMIDAVCAAGVGSDPCEAVWVDGDFLLEHGVKPWAGLPFWLPEVTGHQAMNDLDSSRARAAGYCSRSLIETARATAAWLQGVDEAHAPGRAQTITRERERELLEQWRSR